MSVSSELPGLPVSLIPGVMTCVARTRIKITLAMMTWKTVATIIVATTVPPSVIAGPYFVHLLSDEASFREAFSRFPNDAVNGLSPDKLKRLGQEAEVLQIYEDSTVKVRFDDGLEHDLPVEALVSEFDWPKEPISDEFVTAESRSDLPAAGPHEPAVARWWDPPAEHRPQCRRLSVECPPTVCIEGDGIVDASNFSSFLYLSPFINCSRGSLLEPLDMELLDPEVRLQLDGVAKDLSRNDESRGISVRHYGKYTHQACVLPSPCLHTCLCLHACACPTGTPTQR